MNRDVAFSAYPILLKPAYKDYIWGGTRIAERYGRDVPLSVCAESWEIADRPEGMGTVVNGVYEGCTLGELVAAFGRELVGVGFRGNSFPLLVKLIDAQADLSVQVHPNNANAVRTGGEPKTEMWVILDAAPGAKIYAGLRRGTTRESFLAALHAKRLGPDALAAVPAVAGQAIFVPGGRVHAIGAGCLLLEVQQNSNTTYRVYDWDRLGADGAPRPLHLDQALAVIDWEHAEPEVMTPVHEARGDGWERRAICACPHFRTAAYTVTDTCAFTNAGESFHALFVAAGQATITGGGASIVVAAGTSCLLPAALADYTIRPHTASVSLIHITHPSLAG
jgi:mannose-6-phosphate isomerase